MLPARTVHDERYKARRVQGEKSTRRGTTRTVQEVHVACASARNVAGERLGHHGQLEPELCEALLGLLSQ
eukprot:5889008-Prymnesium_polylepis.2